jgi:chemotaxis protein methyltransferase WspC
MKKPRELEAAVLKGIAARLAETVGIEPSMLDARRIEWTVERRSTRLHLVNGAEYLALLAASSEELDEFVDELAIQETRFFRDAAVFERIAEWVQTGSYNAQQPLRVLSAPCSTGQEAYSLAATLVHSGLPPESFVIDAFDLSTKAIDYARIGIYPEGTLKHAQHVQANACGVLRNNHWHMHEALRDRIHFERRNLIQPRALDIETGYHLILCRNLVIYLHTQARAMLSGMLAQALLPGGLLIIGAADRAREIDALFAPIGPAASFTFIRKEHVADREQVVESAHSVGVQDSAQVTRTDRPRARVHEAEAASVPSAAADYFRRAHEHYGLGNLREAEYRCRQALYLDPGFLSALELLEDLWKLHPNSRLRRALCERIRRARPRSDMASRVAPVATFTVEGGIA